MNDLNSQRDFVKIKRSLDIVFCMGFTHSPDTFNEKFATFLLDIRQEVENVVNGYSTEIKRLRVKIINFGSYTHNPFAITESPFFTLIGDNENQFNQMMDFVNGLDFEGYDGQGNNGLEALNAAMRSPSLTVVGERESYKKVIAVLTDTGAKPLGENADRQGYPQNAPKNVEEMVDWWNDNVKNNYVVFATPKDEVWESFNANKHCFRYVIEDFYKYSTVFDQELKKLLTFIANI